MRDILDGLFLMCVGMGTVFLFLSLLIATTGLIRRAVGGPDPAPAGPSGGPGGSGDDDALRTAVISAAVTHHRRHD